MPLTLVALDTETTGLSPNSCELVEVAALRFAWEGQVLDRYETLIDPGCPIPAVATAVHGITDNMVAGRPTIEEAIPRLFAFLEAQPSLLLIHNAGFDLSFLRKAAERLGIACPDCPVLCTLGFARRRFREMQGHRLDLLVQRFFGGTKADHRAGGDADALRQIFLHMLAREPVITGMEALWASAKIGSLRPLRQEPPRREAVRLTSAPPAPPAPPAPRARRTDALA